MSQKPCRKCSECKHYKHHWIENTEAEDAEDPEFACKHCEVLGRECPSCDGDGYSRMPSLGDEPCQKCNGDGVLEVERTSPGGIILPSMPQEPEPPPPEEPKKKPWTFTIGWELQARHDPEFARRALEDLYKVVNASGVGKRSLQEQAKYERTLDLLNKLAFEITGEVPGYEQLC